MNMARRRISNIQYERKVPLLAISLKHCLYYLEEINLCHNKRHPGLGIDLSSLKLLWVIGMLRDLLCCL